jgi:N-acetylglutamate synthase-like GNAT family acetyltransferase
MRIRKAKISDAKDISELMIKDIKLIKSKKYSKKQIIVMIDYANEENIKNYIKKWDVFIAIKNKKISGTITLDSDLLVSPYVFNSNNFVRDPIMQNMLIFAEKRLKKLKNKKIRLISLPTTKEYFQKKGYVVINQLILGKNIKFKEYLLEKDLSVDK